MKTNIIAGGTRKLEAVLDQFRGVILACGVLVNRHVLKIKGDPLAGSQTSLAWELHCGRTYLASLLGARLLSFDLVVGPDDGGR